jgi:hypothetical protein
MDGEGHNALSKQVGGRRFFSEKGNFMYLKIPKRNNLGFVFSEILQ